MPAKPPFLRLHYVTLLSVAVLTAAAVGVQYVTYTEDYYVLDARSVPTEEKVITQRRVFIRHGIPYSHECRYSTSSFYSYKLDPDMLKTFDALKNHPKAKLDGSNRLLISTSNLPQDFSALYERMNRPELDYEKDNKLGFWRNTRNEDLFRYNALILAGAIVALSLILETLLRWYERRALQPALIATASLYYSDLYFSLLTLLIASLSLAVLLALSFQKHVDQKFVVDTEARSAPGTSFELNWEYKERFGWPYVHFEKIWNFGMGVSPESEMAREARLLQPGEVSLQQLQEIAPGLLKQLQHYSSADSDFFPTSAWNITSLVQNLATNFAIVGAIAFLTEFLQRRRKKPTSESVTPPPLTRS